MGKPQPLDSYPRLWLPLYQPPRTGGIYNQTSYLVTGGTTAATLQIQSQTTAPTAQSLTITQAGPLTVPATQSGTLSLSLMTCFPVGTATAGLYDVFTGWKRRISSAVTVGACPTIPSPTLLNVATPPSATPTVIYQNCAPTAATTMSVYLAQSVLAPTTISQNSYTLTANNVATSLSGVTLQPNSVQASTYAATWTLNGLANPGAHSLAATLSVPDTATQAAYAVVGTTSASVTLSTYLAAPITLNVTDAKIGGCYAQSTSNTLTYQFNPAVAGSLQLSVTGTNGPDVAVPVTASTSGSYQAVSFTLPPALSSTAYGPSAFITACTPIPGSVNAAACRTNTTGTVNVVPILVCGGCKLVRWLLKLVKEKCLLL